MSKNLINSARYNARMQKIFDTAIAEKEKQRLRWEIDEKILEVANLYNEVTTSDLQGIASAKSQEIVDLVKKEIIACSQHKPKNAESKMEWTWAGYDEFKQCLQKKGLI
jgi:hypothetical protein